MSSMCVCVCQSLFVSTAFLSVRVVCLVSMAVHVYLCVLSVPACVYSRYFCACECMRSVACICVCVRERASECVCNVRVRACVCVWERESAGEREKMRA